MIMKKPLRQDAQIYSEVLVTLKAVHIELSVALNGTIKIELYTFGILIY
jgi:hypothetical protein